MVGKFFWISKRKGEIMNLGTVMITKKRMITIPEEVIDKLKMNIKVDPICFIWDKETNEITLKVMKFGD